MTGLLILSLVAWVPPGGYVVDKAAQAARRRQGFEAVYAVQSNPAAPLTTLRISGGTARWTPSPPPPAPELVRALLAGDVRNAVSLVGAELQPTRLALFEGRSAIAIGVAHAREMRAQVWVDAERWVPVRVLAGDLDLRLLDTRGLLSLRGLPERIEARLGGRLVWRARLVSRPRLQRRPDKRAK